MVPAGRAGPRTSERTTAVMNNDADGDAVDDRTPPHPAPGWHMPLMRPGRNDDRTSPSTARLRYLPGLDGLRALAVLAVVLYHAGLPLRGGFLGVEVFFVLSGFLITALLRTEWLTHGRI